MRNATTSQNSVNVTSTMAIRLWARFLQTKQPDGSVIVQLPQVFCRVFPQLPDEVSINNLLRSPYGMRRVGATRQFRATYSFGYCCAQKLLGKSASCTVSCEHVTSDIAAHSITSLQRTNESGLLPFASQNDQVALSSQYCFFLLPSELVA